MTMPQQGRGAPAFEQVAQDVIAAARGRQQHPVPPELARVLTPQEKAEADKVAQKRLYCHLCGGAHAMPGTAACPRLASFELDGEGKVKAGTFWPGVKWAKGRVEFVEDLLEEDGDGG